MEGSDELDRWIDGALAGYSGAEPLAGLEERVLNRVRAVEAGRRGRIMRALALAAVAAVVMAVIAERRPQAPAPKHDAIASVVTPAAVRHAAAVEGRRVEPKRPRQRFLPKQDQFPAPAPITSEERELVAFVEQHPAEAQQVFAELEKSGEPIEIQPIQIPLLDSDGAQ
jgi:hypothetical protein